MIGRRLPLNGYYMSYSNKQRVKVSHLKEGVYLHRHKPIRFNGLATPGTPQRESEYLDDFDIVFDSKEDYFQWNKEVTAGLAELDEAMNYCKYFVRDKGNVGRYIREGKSFPVDGSWVGAQDFDSYPPCQPFVRWLEENGWRETWFELMDRYKNL